MYTMNTDLYSRMNFHKRAAAQRCRFSSRQRLGDPGTSVSDFIFSERLTLMEDLSQPSVQFCTIALPPTPANLADVSPGTAEVYAGGPSGWVLRRQTEAPPDLGVEEEYGATGTVAPIRSSCFITNSRTNP